MPPGQLEKRKPKPARPNSERTRFIWLQESLKFYPIVFSDGAEEGARNFLFFPARPLIIGKFYSKK
jgi:hypothetical protein